MTATLPHTAAPAGWSALDPCVHCGFCLPACPTYLATGDENDSPRGRIVLMRGLERGEFLASDPAVRHHLDRCLGCRGCEPSCPSGVGYGTGLETARELLAASRRRPAGLVVFRHAWLHRLVFGAARLLRATGLPGLLAGRSRTRFPLALLSASAPGRVVAAGVPPTEGSRGTVALFRGCVSDALFAHVHDATRRTLAANGYRVVEVPGQACCGAPLAHAGDAAGSDRLLAQNFAAFAETDAVVVNAAGCGAHLKAGGGADRVRDVAELLAAAGPREGAPLPLTVAYDPPCHLQHAQGIHNQVLQLLAAIPELQLRQFPGADRCCGSAGVFNLEHPELAGTILDQKLAPLLGADPPLDVVTTGNPGCLMQIGAGLATAGARTVVAHPVELLDWSYAAAGYYAPADA